MARESENAPPVPRSLPPPYTGAGVQSKELRTHAPAFSTTTELLLGPKPTRFLLHTHLLTSQSPYFRAALLGPFLESSTNSIALRDIDVSIFELCVSWLYTGSINPLPFKDGKPAYYTLLNLWILADRLCFEGLRNQVVDTIADLADRTNSVLTPSDTRILYSDAVRSSAPLRALVLDLFAFKKTDKLLAEHEDRWHAGFLRDLVVLLKKPVPQAVLRHRLVMWFPATWATTQACEGCRTVVRPRCASVKCEDCGVVWCARCVGEGVGMAGWEDGNPGRFVSGRVEDGVMGVNASGMDVRGVLDGGLLPIGSPGEDTGRGTRESSAAVSGWEALALTADGARDKKVRVRKWQSCKPWRGSRCAIYHEHKETERCGDIFMGR